MTNDFLCICCKRRKRMNNAYISEKYLGICSDCGERLEHIPKDTVLPGTSNASCLFSVLYYRGIISSAIRRYKFFGQQRYSKIFIMLMYNYLKDFHLEQTFDLITMVPLSRKRLLERGYNQTELLAEPLAKMLNIPFSRNCIYKKKHTVAQSQISNNYLRRDNAKDAYLADTRNIKGKSILIIDDIFTTGATIESCAKELKDKGAVNVAAATLAKTMKKHT